MERELTIIMSRQDMSNLIFSLLFLLGHPGTNSQEVAIPDRKGYTNLRIMSKDQNKASDPIDPANVECKKFLAIIKRNAKPGMPTLQEELHKLLDDMQEDNQALHISSYWYQELNVLLTRYEQGGLR